MKLKDQKQKWLTRIKLSLGKINSFLAKHAKILTLVICIISTILLTISYFAYKSGYYVYIQAKIAWNFHCRDELTKLNPGSIDYLNKGDSIADCLFIEPFYHLEKYYRGKVLGQRTGPMRYPEYNSDNKFCWDFKEIYLDINDTKIKDLSPLERLTMVDGLMIKNAKIKNINFVKDLNLNFIYIYDSELSDISGLQGKTLKWLVLNNTKVSNLSPLYKSRMDMCRITGNKNLTDISVFASMSVESVTLDNTGIKTLEPLAKCKGLRSLSIDDCKIEDISPIGNSKISDLSLNGTKVNDLSALKQKKYSSISIMDTLVHDLKPLCNKDIFSLFITGSPAAKRPIPKCLKVDQLIKDSYSFYTPKTKGGTGKRTSTSIP